MIPEIKKILYTTDLSKNARYAFSYAASLSNKYNAPITILHVLEELSYSSQVRLMSVLGEDRMKELQDRNIQEVIDTIKSRIDQLCSDMNSELEDNAFKVENISVLQGQPVETILAEADKLDCDLIVMGTHGQGLLADVMIGSTARRVVRRSSRPVLTIRLPE